MPVQEEEILLSPRNSEEVNDIITAVPPWILRWGITLVFSVLLAIVLGAAFIRYPDVVKTPLKINSINAPKTIIAYQPGKLVKILVNDNQQVNANQTLAYIESTAKHEDVIKLRKYLAILNQQMGKQELSLQQLPQSLNLGELQGAYQNFYQEFLRFLGTQRGGFYLSQKSYLQKDLNEISKLQQQILKQKEIQLQEFANIEEEYGNYKKLKSKNVISNSEFKAQENKYLSAKYPLEQTTTALINNNSSYLAKQKELATLENTIREEQSKFVQALNSMVTETETWLRNYVISATIAGKVSYVGILQENQNVTTNQELFMVNPGNANFFGEVQIPQYNMGKVGMGQRVLVKLRSYPFEEYGAIEGKIAYLTDAALKDSVFFAKIDFKGLTQKDGNNTIVLKQGMMADAEIITKESSLLQRFLRNVTKMFN
ncbi:HlyD family secretion protein [Pedobacter sp. SL55]|uniref:HlyD family secretion protein n=1 Tax=Pedobacter sp. SL55 TaxID=2995161 RepID=UPI00227101E6|nr:HlyD family efflux transporter periplasmic adaptor subunit [Pedobacter sp. SL55]WAC41395.1 HlyD family efflux transporter periplasmic adaptor subunit [Pedobacter sp. SL55]